MFHSMTFWAMAGAASRLDISPVSIEILRICHLIRLSFFFIRRRISPGAVHPGGSSSLCSAL